MGFGRGGRGGEGGGGEAERGGSRTCGWDSAEARWRLEVEARDWEFAEPRSLWRRVLAGRGQWPPSGRGGGARAQGCPRGTDRWRQAGSGTCPELKELSSKTELILPKMLEKISMAPAGRVPPQLREEPGDPSAETAPLGGAVEVSAGGRGAHGGPECWRR